MPRSRSTWRAAERTPTPVTLRQHGAARLSRPWARGPGLRFEFPVARGGRALTAACSAGGVLRGSVHHLLHVCTSGDCQPRAAGGHREQVAAVLPLVPARPPPRNPRARAHVRAVRVPPTPAGDQRARGRNHHPPMFLLRFTSSSAPPDPLSPGFAELSVRCGVKEAAGNLEIALLFRIFFESSTVEEHPRTDEMRKSQICLAC